MDRCEIDPTGTGSTFTQIKVLKDVPGSAGLSATRQTSYDMQLEIPGDIECVGGSTGTICLIRCRNGAFAGRKLRTYCYDTTDLLSFWWLCSCLTKRRHWSQGFLAIKCENKGEDRDHREAKSRRTGAAEGHEN